MGRWTQSALWSNILKFLFCFWIFTFLFCFSVCGYVLYNVEAVLKTEILNSSKDYKDSLTCLLAVSMCRLSFCNNLLMKFTAWVPALPTRPLARVSICANAKSRLQGPMGKPASHPGSLWWPPGEPLLSPMAAATGAIPHFCPVPSTAANLGLYWPSGLGQTNRIILCAYGLEEMSKILKKRIQGYFSSWEDYVMNVCGPKCEGTG